jgi:GAF domain-containing protein
MSNFLYDAEIQRDFDEIRRINEHARRAKEERDERLRAELAIRAAQRAAEQQRLLAARLDSDLRTAFFDANPAAVESDWNRLKDSIRDEHMRAAASKGATNVFDKIRDEAFEREQETLARRSRFEQLPERA